MLVAVRIAGVWFGVGVARSRGCRGGLGLLSVWLSGALLGFTWVLAVVGLYLVVI